MRSADATDAVARRWDPPPVEGRLGDYHQAQLPTAKSLEQVHEQARQEGYAEGHAKGYAEGLAEGRARAATDHEALRGVLAHLADPTGAIDDTLVEALGGLVTQVARHLVRRELKSAPDEIVGVIREALKALPPASELTPTVRVNPEDAELLGEVLSGAGEPRPWHLEADPLIARGGCIVETADSFIDASVETRINAIASRMFGGSRIADGAADDGEARE